MYYSSSSLSKQFTFQLSEIWTHTVCFYRNSLCSTELCTRSSKTPWSSAYVYVSYFLGLKIYMKYITFIWKTKWRVNCQIVWECTGFNIAFYLRNLVEDLYTSCRNCGIENFVKWSVFYKGDSNYRYLCKNMLYYICSSDWQTNIVVYRNYVLSSVSNGVLSSVLKPKEEFHR